MYTLDEKNYPILQLTKQGRHCCMIPSEIPLESICKLKDELAQLVKKPLKVRYLPESTIETIIDNDNSEKELSELAENVDNAKGIILMKNSYAVFYEVTPTNVKFFGFHGLILTTYMVYENGLMTYFVNDNYGDESKELIASGALVFVMMFVDFLNTVLIQEKVIINGEKKSSNKDYKTNIKRNIEIINVAYWTKYQIAATTRREHERRYKSGKVAIIEETEVKAHTRKARKLAA